MDHFNYRDGTLCAEDVPLSVIAAEVGTPVYVYSAATLTRHFNVFRQALEWAPDHLICYAVKANSNIAVLRLLGDLGAGMDVVSIGEYARARTAGVPGSRIVFSGVGKTRDEMRLALEGGIRQFNVESEPELLALSETAAGMGIRAPVALRINPDVDAKTHEKISTGKSENKFGIPIARAREAYARAADLPGIEVVGVDMHIGSQLTDLDPYRLAYARMADLVAVLRADGHDIRRLDMGGGLGIPYRRDNSAPPLPIEYGQVIRETVGDLGCEIVIEPGRNIAGNAGVLLASVIYLKEGEGRDFLILDAAMNDLVRPAMYAAHHDIVPVRESVPGADLRAFDVVGPVCETGDTFLKAAQLPALAADDLVVFRSAGAYGAVMASEYNSRPLVPEVLVDGDRFAVIRPRPTLEQMLSREALPDWF
ncbi:MAG: diaminopimelate decarboxylase [Paracoccus sp. (in: a-proteobacteria)]|nr:diaminopimelate decarboxylase [Paracoccus sp. (in: a-proteobacteria)]